MSIFYQIDSTRGSVRENWWSAKQNPISFVLFMILKWLRAKNPSASDDATCDSILPFVIESLPEEIARRFEPLTLELNEWGFSDPVYHYIHDPVSGTHLYWATFRHETGQYFARIHNRYWDRAQKRERALFLLFFTAYADGSFLVSSSGQPDTAEPPGVTMIRMPKAKTLKLWEAHLQRSTDLSLTTSIRPVRSQADVLEESERLHLLQRDFHVQRGFFREPTEQESEKSVEFKAKVEEVRAHELRQKYCYPRWWREECGKGRCARKGVTVFLNGKKHERDDKKRSVGKAAAALFDSRA